VRLLIQVLTLAVVIGVVLCLVQIANSLLYYGNMKGFLDLVSALR
jgi:purine-cytosine permease-like protein